MVRSLKCLWLIKGKSCGSGLAVGCTFRPSRGGSPSRLEHRPSSILDLFDLVFCFAQSFSSLVFCYGLAFSLLLAGLCISGGAH